MYRIVEQYQVKYCKLNNQLILYFIINTAMAYEFNFFKTKICILLLQNVKHMDTSITVVKTLICVNLSKYKKFHLKHAFQMFEISQ